MKQRWFSENNLRQMNAQGLSPEDPKLASQLSSNPAKFTLARLSQKDNSQNHSARAHKKPYSLGSDRRDMTIYTDTGRLFPFSINGE